MTDKCVTADCRVLVNRDNLDQWVRADDIRPDDVVIRISLDGSDVPSNLRTVTFDLASRLEDLESRVEDLETRLSKRLWELECRLDDMVRKVTEIDDDLYDLKSKVDGFDQ